MGQDGNEDDVVGNNEDRKILLDKAWKHHENLIQMIHQNLTPNSQVFPKEES